jgi:hypothetical protein
MMSPIGGTGTVIFALRTTLLSAGHHILGRDNKLLLHITDTTACPNAPAKVRRDAEVILMEKGKLELAAPVLSVSDTLQHSGTSSDAENSKFVVVKKRKTGGNLDHYVDKPMLPQQKADADVMFFRYVF